MCVTEIGGDIAIPLEFVPYNPSQLTNILTKLSMLYYSHSLLLFLYFLEPMHISFVVKRWYNSM
jgi:hypothetical protein